MLTPVGFDIYVRPLYDLLFAQWTLRWLTHDWLVIDTQSTRWQRTTDSWLLLSVSMLLPGFNGDLVLFLPILVVKIKGEFPNISRPVKIVVLCHVYFMACISLNVWQYYLTLYTYITIRFIQSTSKLLLSEMNTHFVCWIVYCFLLSLTNKYNLNKILSSKTGNASVWHVFRFRSMVVI